MENASSQARNLLAVCVGVVGLSAVILAAFGLKVATLVEDGLRNRIIDMWKKGLRSGRAVITFQYTKKRPEGVVGGNYYPDHGVVHVKPNPNMHKQWPHDRGGLENLLYFRKQEAHHALHIIPEGVLFHTNNYWFGLNSPGVDRLLTLQETVQTMAKQLDCV